MIRGIIFDMDGVLVNSEKLKAQAWKRALLDYGIEGGDEWYRKNIGNSRDALSALAIKEFNLTSAQIEEISAKKRNNYFTMLKEATVPIESSVRFLKSIPKSCVIGIASSEYRKIIESKIRMIGIEDMIRAVTSGVEEVKKDKPDPEVYLCTAKKLNVRPENCIAIEDSKIGVESAKNAEMYCIGFRNPNSGNQDLSRADLIADNLSSLEISILLQK